MSCERFSRARFTDGSFWRLVFQRIQNLISLRRAQGTLLSLSRSAELLFVINGSFWKLFFQRNASHFPPFCSRVFEHNTCRYIRTRVSKRDLSLRRIYTHTYIVKRRKNEFWRHALRGRTQGTTHTRAQICSRMYAFSSL